MKKKLFLLVMAIFAILPNYNVANAQEGGDGILLTPVPHRARGNANKACVYVNYNENMGSAEVTFTGVLNNVTIKVYYEGMYINEVEVGTTSAGDVETIDFYYGEGNYRIVVETDGQTIYDKSYEYIDWPSSDGRN